MRIRGHNRFIMAYAALSLLFGTTPWWSGIVLAIPILGTIWWFPKWSASLDEIPDGYLLLAALIGVIASATIVWSGAFAPFGNLVIVFFLVLVFVWTVKDKAITARVTRQSSAIWHAFVDGSPIGTIPDTELAAIERAVWRDYALSMRYARFWVRQILDIAEQMLVVIPLFLFWGIVLYSQGSPHLLAQTFHAAIHHPARVVVYVRIIGLMGYIVFVVRVGVGSRNIWRSTIYDKVGRYFSLAPKKADTIVLKMVSEQDRSSVSTGATR